MPPFHEEQHVYRRAIKSINTTELSRTQHKLQLQRLSFLTNDKNYLDHPQNMKRLTKELDRVNREYRNVRRYEDPVKESFKRLVERGQKRIPSLDHIDIDESSTNSSDSDSIYSTSADKTGFLSRWFTQEIPISQHMDHLQDASVMHPTIAHHINKRKTTRY